MTRMEIAFQQNQKVTSVIRVKNFLSHLYFVRAESPLCCYIQGSMCNDCIVVCCCTSCALCQMVREMNFRGVPKKPCCCGCTCCDCCVGCQL